MKRVVHILYSGLGGHGSVVFTYLNGHYLTSFEHHIIFFGVEKVLPEYIEECKKRGVAYSYVKKSGLVKSTRNLFRKLNELKANVIVSHSLPIIVVISLLRVTSFFKSIIVEHTPTQFKRRVDVLWSVMSAIIADRIVFLTPKALYETPKVVNIFLSDSKKQIVPNGIDTLKFSPLESKSKNDIPTFISHGRLVPQKDLETLFNGLNNLLNRGLKFNMIIAGAGELSIELKNLAKKLNIDSHVTFTGRLNEIELIEALRKSDIYINTSVAETMSTAIMQAMSSELLCIVSDIEENTSLIEDGVTGFTFKVKDDQDLADKLVMTYSHDYLNISKSAREFLTKNYSAIKMSDNYHELTSIVLKS